MQMKYKIGDKVKSTHYKNTGDIGVIVSVDTFRRLYTINGFKWGSPSESFKGAYEYMESLLELVVEEKAKVESDFEIPYEEPVQDEMDDNCVATCKPGRHECGKI